MKKTALITAVAGILAAGVFVAFGIFRTNSSKPAFPASGEVLLGEAGADEKTVPVSAGGTYTLSKGSIVRFKSSDGKPQMITSESFVDLTDDSTMALSGGVLLDFNGLSGNFINNYYIPEGMQIYKSGQSYEVATTNGNVQFGDHLWKLADNKYIVRSPELKVYFAEDDVRDVKDYVQVSVTDEGIVRLLTAENLWTTLSPDCYIETQSGVKVYPIQQRVEDENYKLSLAGLSVNADDLITLTEDEMRRQIVPAINITSIDGTKGDDGAKGTDGQTGTDGINGTDGRAGTDGTDGSDGEDGAAGAAGTSGGSGASGGAGSGGANGSSGTNGTDGTNGEGGGNGKDGINGRNGTDAADGIDGGDGPDGAEGGQGTSGTDGTNGTNGSDGTDGVTGNNGADGSVGDIGKTGAGGADGNAGEDGIKGSQGSGGVNGDNGSGGDDGLKGDDGTNGTTGGTGAAGRDASSTTTINSMIPVITIGEWEVTSTGLRGSLLIDDPSEFLKAVNDESQTIAGKYPAYVKIYDNRTDEVLYCWSYSVDSQGKPIYSNPEDTNFFQHINSINPEGEVFFGVDEITKHEELQPDTSYRLEVSAYYKSEGKIYNRVFLSRNFYTDSSGIILEKEKSEIKAVKLDTNMVAGYADNVSKVDVYLLTPDQNKDFSLSKTSSNDYIYRYTIQYTASGANVTGTPSVGPEGKGIGYGPVPVDDKESIPLKFVPVTEGAEEELDQNTLYIARAVVTMMDESVEKEVLTAQELELWTLKATPEIDEERKTTAIYNRVTGAFEVYRPRVSDPDNSAVEYTYTAKRYNADKKEWEVVAVQKRTPGESEPVEFYLPTSYTYTDPEGKTQRKEYQYKFDVSLEAFDNEKTVYYELGESDEVAVAGTTLPKIVCEENEEFNYAHLHITIPFDSMSSMKFGPDYPLYFDISCDEYYSNTIEVTQYEQWGVRSSYPMQEGQKVTKDDWHFNNFQYDEENNVYTFDLDLYDLYKNQKYTVAITGCAKLATGGEGENGVYRELGTVTFRTANTPIVNATWKQPTDKEKSSTSAINVKLALAPQSTTGSTYESDEITKGQVILQLYEGQGSSGLLMGTAYINSKENLDKLMGDGLVLNDSMFGTLALDASNSYTLKVASISDETYNLPQCPEYTNYFDTIINETKIIAAEPKPPALPANPATHITVTPIKNKNVRSYGGTYRADLEDEAVVGYVLSARYDNSTFLAQKVTYSVMEYLDFFKAISEDKIDPVGNYMATEPQYGIPKLLTFELPIDKDTVVPSKTSLPRVAIVFDDNVTEPEFDAVRASSYCYKVPPLTIDESGVKHGMSRGYRYLAAYTVEYAATSDSGSAETKLYPYTPEEEYDKMRISSGIGIVNGAYRFNGENAPAYILNSGMIECPLEDPRFNTYIYKAEPLLQVVEGQTDFTMMAAMGIAQLKYHYSDPDQTLGDGTTSGVIKYVGMNADDEPVDMTATLTPCTEEAPWQTAEFSFRSYVGTDYSDVSTFINPKVEYLIYRLIYKPVLDYYGMDPDETEIGMGAIHCDWDWDGFVSAYNDRMAKQGRPEDQVPHVTLTNKADLNYLQFNFFDYDETGSTRKGLTTVLAKRAFASEITAMDEDGKTVTKILPIVEPGTGIHYSRMSTGEIAELKPGKIQFSARLLFDNGNSGWAYSCFDTTGAAAGISDMFGIYSIKINEYEQLSPYYYLIKENDFSLNPYGGAFTKLTRIPPFEDAVVAGKRFQADYPYLLPASGSFNRWLYPFRFGVDSSGTNDNVGSYDGKIIFPKQISKLEATFKGDSGTSVDVFIPVLNYHDYNSMRYSIMLNEFDVGSVSRAKAYDATTEPAFPAVTEEGTIIPFPTDDYYIAKVALFDRDKTSEEQAKDLANVTESFPGYISTTNVIVDGNGKIYGTAQFGADGKIIPGTLVPVIRQLDEKTGELVVTEGLPELKGKNGANLEQNHKYRITFFMDFEKEGVASQNILIGQDKIELGYDDTKAVYETETSNGVQIEYSLIDYNGNNTSFYNKGLSVRFNIRPRAYGVTMKYEIYDTPEGAERGTADAKAIKPGTEEPYGSDPAVPYMDLSSFKMSELFSTPLVLAGTNNVVFADLTPEKVRIANTHLPAGASMIENLLPNVPYYIRLTALDSSGNELGYSTSSFTPKKATTGTVIGLKERTDKSISFTVTVSDPQHMLMGYHYDSGDPTDPTHGIPIPEEYNNTPFYTVRFTDADGKLIKSGYEDYVYSIADLKRGFDLGRIEPLMSGTPYYCNIYAVTDQDLDGLSLPVDASGTAYPHSFFFGKEDVRPVIVSDQVVGYTAPAFTALINSLWDASGNPIGGADADTIRTNFLLGKQVKETAPEGGLYIPPDGYNFTPVTLADEQKVVRLNLKESVGIVTLEEQEGKPVEVQGFEKIEWQIQDQETAAWMEGIALKSKKDDMFHPVYNGTELTSSFYYDLIPEDGVSLIAGREYIVMVNLYKEASTAGPADYSFSRTMIY